MKLRVRTSNVRGLFIPALLSVACLAGCAHGGAGSHEPAPLLAASAAVEVKEAGGGEVTVEFVVAAAKDRIARRGVVFLDSHADFTDPENLCVALSASAAEGFHQQGVTDLEAHFLGKRIRARGCVMRFEERRYLPVLDADDIEMVAVEAE